MDLTVSDRSKTISVEKTIRPPSGRELIGNKLINQPIVLSDRSKAGLTRIHDDSLDLTWTGRKNTSGRKKHSASGWPDADFLSREIKSDK